MYHVSLFNIFLKIKYIKLAVSIDVKMEELYIFCILLFTFIAYIVFFFKLFTDYSLCCILFPCPSVIKQ